MATRRPAPRSSSASSDIDVDNELQQLLKEQEDFMRQRARPAAKITRVGAAGSVASPPITEHMPEAETAPDDGPQVVGLVTERDAVCLDGDRRTQPLRVTSGGFPAVTRRGESLFGRRQRQQPPSNETKSTGELSGKGKIVERAPNVVTAKPIKTQSPTPTQSSRRPEGVSDREWNEIDANNAATLRNMSTADIRAAQQELFSSLDPVLLAKLKNRRAPLPSSSPPKKTTIETKREDVVIATKRLEAAGMDLSKIETEEQLFAEAARLPLDERAKHAWMQPVTETDGASKSKMEKKKRTGHLSVRANQPRRPDSKASGERFDFNGEALVVNAVALPPSHSGLYHHGDDPEAAGYTMDELLHLARSTVASQRAVALLTIGKILHKRQKAETDVAPAVLPAELPVALRMTLDDQNYTALSAAIAAMHAYLCGDDDLVGDFESAWGTIVTTPPIHRHVNVGTTTDELLHEVIYMDTTESDEDGSKMGDQELASLDPVQGLLNMNIVSRLSFIVTTIQLPDEDAMDKVLDLLIHIASHSPRAAQAVATDRKLIKALQTKYLENVRVLTLQTEPMELFTQATARTVKTLRLIRVLCQGSRDVATMLVENGVIQTTKGFLGIRSDTPTTNPLELIQVETLRVWRVLLEYGLDFHCFAYLHPLLCGFDGVGLVRDKTDTASGVKQWSDRCLAAIFAALEAFARLDMIHEAQHYFHQLSFYHQLARREIMHRLSSQSLKKDPVLVVALRFLTVCCRVTGKFQFDLTPFRETYKLLCATPLLSSEPDVLVAVITFGMHVLDADMLGDDEDEDEVRKQFFLKWKPVVSTLIEKDGVQDRLQLCALLLLATDAFLRTDHHDDAFIRSLYSAALTLVQDLKTGHHFWIHSLFTQVLFNAMVLQKTGFFPDLQDATTMGRVLLPIYQALVNSTSDQEGHSYSLFSSHGAYPGHKYTCHLVVPQDEHSYVGSNLPLPFYWMFCPFSRLEYSSQSNDETKKKLSQHAATTLGPSHAEADEMKVIVSAACRYIDQLETIVGVVRSRSSESTVELGDEDKLFHLMHVFFSGTDVLFDEYVDLAFSKLLQKYALSVLYNPNPTALYDGLLRNLRQFESLEAVGDRAQSNDTSDEPSPSFTTATQTVLTFVERLVNEFTSSSFGNTHFARLVTLFLLHDFPLAIRKWVWKELAGSRLLHRLEPFGGGTDARGATGLRATRDAKRSDETLIRAMTQAIATRLSGVISHERGPFAYWLAIHHTAAYVFGDGDNRADDLSFARQQLLQDLVVDASPVVWRHLLSHDTTAFLPIAGAEIKQARVDRVLQHAAFSESQITPFRAMLDSIRE